MKPTIFVVLVSLALLSCGGTTSNSSNTSPPTESTTTTSIAPLTAAQVKAAVPTPAELPFGWTYKGEITQDESVDVDLRNTCALPSEKELAAPLGEVAFAETGWLGVPGGGDIGDSDAGAGRIYLRAFATAEGASRFMDAVSAAATSCANGYSYDDVEDEGTSNEMKWQFIDGIAIGSAPIAGSDSSFLVTETRKGKGTDKSNRKYKRDLLDYYIYARTGDVVTTVRLGGLTDSGYSTSLSYIPAPEATLAAANSIYPSVLKDIGDRPK